MSAAQPTARRREGLSFNSEDDVAADVRLLRRGYARAANWSLPQVCYHLERIMQIRMAPGPHPPNTPEQDARQGLFREIMRSGRIPDGLKAPEAVMPPAEVGEDAIDALLATLETFKRFPGPIAPHRLFGQQSDADSRKQNLIHCAHHLSFLVPTAAPASPASAHRSTT